MLRWIATPPVVRTACEDGLIGFPYAAVPRRWTVQDHKRR